MLKDLLWLWDAKLQYERQKAQGMAGLLSLLFVIFAVWKWDEWFYPLFEKLGLVSFAKNIGLVSDLSVVTVVNVVAIIFFICLFIGLICLAATVVGFLLFMVGASKLGQWVIALALMPLLAPFLFFQVRNINRMAMSGISMDPKEIREIRKKYKDLEGEEYLLQLYLEQLKRSDEDFAFEKSELALFEWDKAKNYLNRVLPSIKENTVGLLAYHRALKQIYILFPNPLPSHFSRSFEVGIKEDGIKEDKIFGFRSQSLEYGLDAESRRRYYVPALPVEIRSNGERFSLYVDPSSSVEAYDITGCMDFYYIQSSEWRNVVKNLCQSRIDLFRSLHQAHIAFYLFQLVFKEVASEDDYNIFFKGIPNVSNGDVLTPIYQNDVRNEIIRRAEYGEEWAINFLQKVE